ncbi:MAG: hypothetical protein BAJATHORv1_30488 [Candidatus Thorarchaeota archaeon]|nr:MAG: hypothetical protein BAJATHORv1_30488 [Candidatus Thorarchaeota archaeon]
MKARKQIEEYIFKTYGHLVLHDPPEFDEELSVWITKLRSDYPILIRDDKRRKKTLRFLKIPSLGHVVFDEGLHLVKGKTTEEEVIEERVREYLNMWREYAEDIVVKASAERIASLGEVRLSLNPIFELINFIDINGFISKDQIFEKMSKRRHKMNQYVSLLQDLEIIRPYEDKFQPGNLFVAFKERFQSDFDKFISAIFSEILRKRYSYLRDVIHTQNLSKLISVENVIYYPEIHTEEAIPRDYKTLAKEYRIEYHSSISEPAIAAYLRKLEQIDLVSEENGLYHGTQYMRERISEIRTQIPSPEHVWSVPSIY